MVRKSWNDKAPALLLLLASASLAVAFSVPIGAERLARTQYQRLEGYVGAFEPTKASEAAAQAMNPAQSATLGLLARAVRRSYTPVEANALLSRVEQMAQARKEEKPAPVPRKARRPAAPATRAAVAVSSAAAKPEPGPAAAPEAPASETADSVGESYESDPAKYALDASAAQGTITLHLRGLSRSGRRCTLKVAVSNRGDDDFFVRELVAIAGAEDVKSRSFVRLFVEPSRTREGFIVFDKPRPGAVVHVALKEDREKGRVIDIAVPYPF